MASYQFDDLTKNLAGAKSRRGFLKVLLGAGAAVAAATTMGSGLALAAPCGPGVVCTDRQVCCAQGSHHFCCPAGTTCGKGFTCV